MDIIQKKILIIDDDETIRAALRRLFVIFSNFDGDKETLDSIKSDKPSLFLKKSEVNAREILIKVKELLNEN